MSRILLIGATGGVGRRLAPLLIEAGHQVTGLHRKPEQASELRAAGLAPVQGDLMQITPDALTLLAGGHDVIVFCAGAAGSGAERTTQIDGKGPAMAIAAAQANGISRFYLVSAFPDAGRDRQPSDGFEHYMRMKKQADADLAASGLDYVILRPGTLLDADADADADEGKGEDAAGGVALGHALGYGSVKRRNVAAVLAALIARPEIRREVIELTDGDTPVPQAVGALRRD